MVVGVSVVAREVDADADADGHAHALEDAKVPGQHRRDSRNLHDWRGMSGRAREAWPDDWLINLFDQIYICTVLCR